MPALKQLCGVALPAFALTTVYTAPVACAVSTLVVCNRSASTTTFRLAHSPGGVAVTDGHYFVYDALIAGNTTVPLTLGICLAATDMLRAYAGSANLTVIAWGEEQ